MYTIITGGSSGLGLSIAKNLTKTKKLILIGRNEDKLLIAKNSLEGEVLTYFIGCNFYRFFNTIIRSTATNISLHRISDFFLTWIRIGF